MPPIHLPRHFAIFLLILLAAAFLVGNVLIFSGAHAAPPAAQAATLTGTPQVSSTPTATPTPIIASADTTGILILGLILVSIVLIGLVWGSRTRRK